MENLFPYLVNKANLVHNLFLEYLFLVYLSISTCFGLLCAHHQEKQLCLCDTWYLLFWNKWIFSNYKGVGHVSHVEIDKYTKNKYTKNKLCTKLALFTRLFPYVL